MAPSRWAAAYERSITRRPANGPRSLMRTSTERPLSKLVTRTRVPSGSVRCAAVSAFMSYASPLAVGLPWCWRPYQEAIPVCWKSSGAGAGSGGGGGGGTAARGGAVDVDGGVFTRAVAHPLTTRTTRSQRTSAGIAGRALQAACSVKWRIVRQLLDRLRLVTRLQIP